MQETWEAVSPANKAGHYQKGRDSGSLPFLGNDARFLILSFILFIITLSYNTAAYSASGAAIDVAFSIVAVAYVACHGLSRRSKAAAQASKALFVLSVLLFIAGTWLHISLGQLSIHDFSEIEYLGAYLAMFILLFAIIQIFFYTNDWRIRSLVIIVIVLLVAAYFLPSTTGYKPDDEMALSYYGIKALFAGTNPYSIQMSQQLYNLRHYTSIGLTASTNGTIMGIMDYPALYFLAQIPFYLLIRQPPQNLAGGFMHAEGFVFALIFLLSYMLVERRNKGSRPNYLFYISLGLFSLYMPSMIIILMLAVVTMLYSDIAQRYGWLIIGIAISLQEQLWFMSVLLIAYSFNTFGARRAMKDLIGVLAIFTAFNGYFILTDPSGYIGNLLAVTSTILPNSLSPIGYAIAVHFGLPLSALGLLFVSAMVIVLLISLYVNDRKSILLMSTIPFLFLGHATQIYYLLPLVTFALVSNQPENAPAAGRFSKAIDANSGFRAAYLLSLVLLTLATAGMVLQAHWSYTHNFNMSSSEIRISPLNATYFAYHATLSYKNSTAPNLYLIIEANSNGTGVYYGLFNSSIIANSRRCGFPCAVDVNLVNLNGSGRYSLNAMLPSNIPTPAYLSMILSNGEYYYQAPAVRYG